MIAMRSMETPLGFVRRLQDRQPFVGRRRFLLADQSYDIGVGVCAIGLAGARGRLNHSCPEFRMMFETPKALPPPRGALGCKTDSDKTDSDKTDSDRTGSDETGSE